MVDPEDPISAEAPSAYPARPHFDFHSWTRVVLPTMSVHILGMDRRDGDGGCPYKHVGLSVIRTPPESAKLMPAVAGSTHAPTPFGNASKKKQSKLDVFVARRAIRFAHEEFNSVLFNLALLWYCYQMGLLHITEEPEEDSADALDRDAMPARRKKKQARCMYVCMCVRDHVDNWVNHKMDAPSTATAKVVVRCKNVL